MTNRKQFLIFNKKQKGKTLKISCGVPQGSILGPLLFLLYVNDLAQLSNMIRPIMFADDTNLFYSHKDINLLFRIINEELVKTSNWFKANKLSVNADKTKYTFFHKVNMSDYITLRLPILRVNNWKLN